MDAQTLLPCVVLLLVCGAWIFWPQSRSVLTPPREKTRVDYLLERKEVIYDNLRDLNFEYRAGKFPEEDYIHQRDALEHEAAEVLAEMDILNAATQS